MLSNLFRQRFAFSSSSSSRSLSFHHSFSFSTTTTAVSPSSRDVSQDIISSIPDISIDYTDAFINGNLFKCAEQMDSINPATGDAFSKFSICNSSEVSTAIASSRVAFDSGPWSRMSGVERRKILLKFADLIDSNRDYIAKLESLDTGKPVTESHFDIDLSIELITYFAGYAADIQALDTPGSPLTSYLEPVGVVGCIIPWNYPLMEMFYKVSTALACGNTCVVKPPETAPFTCIFAAKLGVEAGLPPGVLNVVPGLGSVTGDAIVGSQLVDKISFTGSGATGRKIMESLHPKKKLTLELGGKSAVIINDPPAGQTVRDIANLFVEACFANSGQVCTAPTRLFVNEKIYDEFVEIAVGQANARKVGDPFDTNTQQGAVQNGMQCDKVLGILDRSAAEGEKAPILMCGGRRLGSKGYFIEPTVYAEVNDDNIVAREEIFGPTMQILKYGLDNDGVMGREMDKVLKRANATEYGLAAGVFSSDAEFCHRAARELKAGTVFVNLYDIWDASIPFGGVKQSGFGREKGYEAVKWFTQRKNVFQQMRRKSFV